MDKQEENKTTEQQNTPAYFHGTSKVGAWAEKLHALMREGVDLNIQCALLFELDAKHMDAESKAALREYLISRGAPPADLNDHMDEIVIVQAFESISSDLTRMSERKLEQFNQAFVGVLNNAFTNWKKQGKVEDAPRIILPGDPGFEKTPQDLRGTGQ